MPFKYWDEAFRTFVFLINRLPTPNLHNKTPLEILFHTKPIYSQLRVFGCTCYPNIRPYNKKKLQFRSIPCTFLGYSIKHKGYKCLDPFGRIYISRDLIFYETSFPFTKTIHVVQPSFVESHQSPLSAPLSVLPSLSSSSSMPSILSSSHELSSSPLDPIPSSPIIPSPLHTVAEPISITTILNQDLCVQD